MYEIERLHEPNQRPPGNNTPLQSGELLYRTVSIHSLDAPGTSPTSLDSRDLTRRLRECARTAGATVGRTCSTRVFYFQLGYPSFGDKAKKKEFGSAFAVHIHY